VQGLAARAEAALDVHFGMSVLSQLTADFAVLLAAEAIAVKLGLQPPIGDRAVKQFASAENIEGAVRFCNYLPRR